MYPADHPLSLDNQAKSLQRIARGYHTQVAMDTNKKLVFCCMTESEANALAKGITKEGWFSRVKQGRTTERFYVAAFYQ